MQPNPGNPGNEQPGQGTQRLPWWESPRFQAVFTLKAGSVKAELSRPARQYPAGA